MREIYYDELTGCYNRRFLHYWINNEIKRANRFASKFALILLDIDDFRNINNNFGHLEGDKVLIEFSKLLGDNIREVDNLVRYGGDEFIILIPNTDNQGAIELSQRIIDNLNSSDIADHSIHCSIGCAIFPEDGTSSEQLISQADNLMYEAKSAGKNRIGIKHKAIRKLQIPSPVTIGRDDETQWCLDHYPDYKTILVGGEAGVGKTRLIYEIKDRLGNAIILRGNAYAALTAVPYHPFRNMFNELISTNYNLVQRVLNQMPEVLQMEIAKLLPDERIVKVGLSETLDKFRLYNAVSDFLNRIAGLFRSEATLLLIDDIHWLDRPSCELMDFLIRSVGDLLRVYGTYRVEEMQNAQINNFLGVWAREKLHTQIILSPLNQPQTIQLIKAIMGNVPSAAAKYIHKQSGGNPFYIEEILRELEVQKKLFWNGQEWIFSDRIEVTIPSSIEETIKRKLNFLDSEIKHYLEISAVYGQEFSADVIAMASKRNVGQILDAFDELCRLGFIKERADEKYFFSEDIVRQIIYKNISRRALVHYHKIVGEAVEILFRNIIPNYYEQLATHFIRANESNKALYYSKKAANKARENYAHDVAIKFYEYVLKYEDNINEIFETKFILADIYSLIGNYKEAIFQLETCLNIDPNSHKVFEKIGRVSESTGNYKKSLESYERGIEITQGTDTVYIFRSDIAWLYTRMGKYLEAEKECEEILKKKEHLGKQTLSDTYVILGVVLLRLGKLDKAEQYFKRALKIRKDMGDKKRIAACYLDLAIGYQDKFNIKMCEKFNNKALEIYRDIGYQEGILLALNNLGVLYANSDIPRAEEYYLKALKKAKLIGAMRTTIFLHNNLGSVEFNRLMLDEAQKNYKQALKLSKEMNFHEGIIFSNIGLSEFYREKGQIKKGRNHLKKACHEAEKLNMRYLDIDCMKEEIAYLLQEGNLKKADSLSKKMSRKLARESNIDYKVDGLLVRGKILVDRQKSTRARTYYNRAINYLKKHPNSRRAGEAYFLRGVSYKREGKLKSALKEFIEANRLFKMIGNLRFLGKIEHEIGHTNLG